MTTMVVAIVVMALVNVAFKAVGPAVLGDREFPVRVQAVVDALPAALLAGLLVVDLLGARWEEADWTMLPGLAAAAALWWRHAPQLLCLLGGVAVTAGLRAVT